MAGAGRFYRLLVGKGGEQFVWDGVKFIPDGLIRHPYEVRNAPSSPSAPICTVMVHETSRIGVRVHPRWATGTPHHGDAV